MDLNYREKGDKLYEEGRFSEAYEEYKQMLHEEGVKLTPRFNNRLLACARKSKKLENRFYAFDLMVGISEEHFDLENYGIEDFKNENALTYLWLLYDLIKEDGFSANLYLNEVLSYLDCFRDKKYCYFLAKLLFKNQAVNKKLLKEFVDKLDYREYSKELQNQDGKTLASEHEQLGYGMAKFYFEIEEYDKADSICEDLLELPYRESKYRPFILNLQSEINLAKKDYKKALEKKNAALEIKEDWFLYHQLGRIHLEMGNAELAGKYFSFALVKNRQNLGFLNKLLSDMRELYSEIGAGELVLLIDSLLYYERKKNNWSVSPELESAEKLQITRENFQKHYRDFRKEVKEILKKKFLPSKKEGIIKNINGEKRFGFVEDGTGKTHHFSTNSLLDDPRDLTPGVRVYFELKERFNPKKGIQENTCEYVIKI